MNIDEIKKRINELESYMFWLDMADRWSYDDSEAYSKAQNELTELKRRLWELEVNVPEC